VQWHGQRFWTSTSPSGAGHEFGSFYEPQQTSCSNSRRGAQHHCLVHKQLAMGLYADSVQECTDSRLVAEGARPGRGLCARMTWVNSLIYASRLRGSCVAVACARTVLRAEVRWVWVTGCTVVTGRESRLPMLILNQERNLIKRSYANKLYYRIHISQNYDQFGSYRREREATTHQKQKRREDGSEDRSSLSRFFARLPGSCTVVGIYIVYLVLFCEDQDAVRQV
jgi:hypothetical protein